MERRTFGFGKLVRDEIPERIRAEGGKVEPIMLDDIAYIDSLKDKITEELTELDPQGGEESIITELADIEEALSCLKKILGVSEEKIAHKRDEKNRQFGSFATGAYVETAEIAANSAWIDHFTSNPEQYPEITPEL